MQIFSFYVQRALHERRTTCYAGTALVESRCSTAGRKVTEFKLAKLFYVTGAVQGVGYRYFTQRVSARVGLVGYVKNLRDGRVEVYAIGSASQLSALRRELERGPHGATVEEVFEEEAAVEEKYSYQFSIERDTW
jgi:acylphosphatase